MFHTIYFMYVPYTLPSSPFLPPNFMFSLSQKDKNKKHKKNVPKWMEHNVFFLYMHKKWSPLCVGQLLLVIGPAMECDDWYVQWHSIGVSWFSLWQLVSITNSFWMSGGPMSISLFTVLGPCLACSIVSKIFLFFETLVHAYSVFWPYLLSTTSLQLPYSPTTHQPVSLLTSCLSSLSSSSSAIYAEWFGGIFTKAGAKC